MRRAGIAALSLAVAAPFRASAEGKMPQMDFHNPLTTAQLVWMVVILLVLYLLLSRWGLPRMGAVLDNRAAVIGRDLEAARAAKTQADRTARAMQATMHAARAKAHAEIADTVATVKAEAARQAASANAELDAQLAKAEARIAAARSTALAALKPVAEQTAGAMLARLVGSTLDQTRLAEEVDAAITRREPA